MSTRRSRIQIKPNTGRKGDNAAAKPAAPLKPQGVRKSSGISVPAPALPVEEPAPNPAEETPCCVGADSETPHVEAAVAEVGVPSQPESTIEKPPPSPPPPAAQPAEPASLPPVEEIGPPEPAAQVVKPPAPPPLPLQRTRASKRPAENEPKNARYRTFSCFRIVDGPPADRSAMTMMDLIYYNPPGNPMPSNDEAKCKNEKTSKVRILEDSAETVDDPAEPEAASDEDGSEASAGPRVRVGPNGEITLDEESLVVRRQAPRSEPRPVVYETGHETNYTSFRRQPHGRRTWTEKQTARFYRALSVCGTDFTLMATFFPERTRQDLKNKFKREERMHRDLVDKAI
ncbi:conserved hypothetical protein, partial [Ixodes scapularis]